PPRRIEALKHDRLELSLAPEPWWAPGGSAWLEAQADGSDAVVLLAYEPPPPDPASGRLMHELEVNAEGSRALAATAARLGARVVFASSADVYGPWHDEPVDESAAAAPSSPY